MADAPNSLTDFTELQNVCGAANADDVSTVLDVPPRKKTKSQIRVEREDALRRENMDIARRLEAAESHYPMSEMVGTLYRNWVQIQEMERLRNESRVKDMEELDEDNAVILKRITNKGRRLRGEVGKYFSLQPQLGSMFQLARKKEMAVEQIKMAKQRMVSEANRELYKRVLSAKGHYGQPEAMAAPCVDDVTKMRGSSKEKECRRIREGNEDIIKRLLNAHSEYGETNHVRRLNKARAPSSQNKTIMDKETKTKSIITTVYPTKEFINEYEAQKLIRQIGGPVRRAKPWEIQTLIRRLKDWE